MRSNGNGFRDQQGSMKNGSGRLYVLCTHFLLVALRLQVFSVWAMCTICDIAWMSTWRLGSVRVSWLL